MVKHLIEKLENSKIIEFIQNVIDSNNSDYTVNDIIFYCILGEYDYKDSISRSLYRYSLLIRFFGIHKIELIHYISNITEVVKNSDFVFLYQLANLISTNKVDPNVISIEQYDNGKARFIESVAESIRKGEIKYGY